jgi:hypothetical protein
LTEADLPKRMRRGAGSTRREVGVERGPDQETLRFAARVLREVADLLEGEDDTERFMRRWREYERVLRGVELRAVELDGDASNGAPSTP